MYTNNWYGKLKHIEKSKLSTSTAVYGTICIISLLRSIYIYSSITAHTLVTYILVTWRVQNLRATTPVWLNGQVTHNNYVYITWLCYKLNNMLFSVGLISTIRFFYNFVYNLALL